VTGQIQQLKEMGFSEEQARQALAECVWDVNKALDLLFTRGAIPDAISNTASGGADDDKEASSATASVGKEVADVSTEARSPSGKSRPEAVSSGGNSPAGPDSAEQSTTASTASSPRSSACADKTSSNVASVSTPLSPEGANNSTPSRAQEAIVEEPREDCAVEPAVASEATVVHVKQLTRVSKAWEMESTGGQLHVKEGDFVSVWQSTVTEHGWIYAEDASDADKAGWLPGCVLEELPSHQRWMRGLHNMEAAHETQLSVVKGEVYKVSVDTRTKEGWIYAEASGVATQSVGDASGGCQSQRSGWVPAFCLEGAEDLKE
jgi:hypothetical protein